MTLTLLQALRSASTPHDNITGLAADEIERLRFALGSAVSWSDEMAKLTAERDALRAALQDMIEISQRNSEAGLMLIAIRKCAQHALEQKVKT